MGIRAKCHRCGAIDGGKIVAISHFLGSDYLCERCVHEYILECSGSKATFGAGYNSAGYNKDEQLIADMVHCRQGQVNFTFCNMCHKRFKCWTI